MDETDSAPIEKCVPLQRPESFRSTKKPFGKKEDVECKIDRLYSLLKAYTLLNEWAHPEYAKAETRYRTFEKRPGFLPSAEDLSTGGFFYVPREDVCVCFSCGLRLSKWYWHENPLEEHLKWAGNCPYLKMVYHKL